MRRSIILIRVTILALISSAAPAPASAEEPPIFNPPKSYYLALGDSVAFGYQRSNVIQGLPPSAETVETVSGRSWIAWSGSC